MNVLDRFRLDGKRLFVTGGSRGFGRAIALAAAEATPTLC
jgi:gluconate 5-dehydrogenase